MIGKNISEMLSFSSNPLCQNNKILHNHPFLNSHLWRRILDHLSALPPRTSLPMYTTGLSYTKCPSVFSYGNKREVGNDTWKMTPEPSKASHLIVGFYKINLQILLSHLGELSRKDSQTNEWTGCVRASLYCKLPEKAGRRIRTDSKRRARSLIIRYTKKSCKPFFSKDSYRE